MYKDIFESIHNEAEKRNLRERTIQLYCSDVRYFLRWIGKNVSDLTLEDAESFLQEPERLTDDDVMLLLKLIFHRQDTQELLKKLLERKKPETP